MEQDGFSIFEISYINSEENQTENQSEIEAFKHYLNKMRTGLAAKHKTKLENCIQIGTLQPGPETVGIFPFEKQWYLYQRESRYDDVEVYGPYSTEDAVLLSIQTGYSMEDYGIPYIKAPANMQFRK